jgi:hypothetical protein
MFHPIKTIKAEITENRNRIRDFVDGYRYEKMIAASQDKIGPYIYAPQTTVTITATTW